MSGGRSSSARLVALGFAVAASLVAYGAAFRTGPETERYDPYMSTVRAMIDAGFFEVHDDGGETVIGLRRDGPALAQSQSLDRLRRDMRNLGLWRVEGGRVRAFLADHSVPGPFETISSWNGSLTYGRSMVGSEVVELARVEGVGPPSLTVIYDPALALGRDAAQPEIDLAEPPAEVPAAPLFPVRCANGRDGTLLIYRIGAEVVVNARGAGACRVQVSVDRRWRSLAPGCTDAGVAEDACQFAPLAAGDEVRILAPGQDEDRVVARYQRAGTLSPGSAILRRMLDGTAIPDLALAPFAAAVASDLRIALRGCAGTSLSVLCSEDIPLSLDEEFQQASDRQLRRHLAEHDGLSAITVMNARTGEVLAMAGHTPPAHRRWCPFAPLCPLPIGSAAKPIFAAAILSADPSLRHLVLSRTPRDSSEILGLSLRRELHNTHPGTNVTFDAFLGNSDNYYAASLLLLGSPAPRHGSVRCRSNVDYSLGGAWLSDRPRSAFESVECGIINAAAVREAFRPQWAIRLNQLFDVNPWGIESLPPDICTADGRVYHGDDFHDAAPWAGLFRGATNRCAMLSSSPARSAFLIDRESTFGNDLIPLVLGDGNGRWTTVKLAEAFSRIVIGREVRATFLSPRYLTATAGTPAPLVEFDQVRAAVTRGMARVFAGTGRQYGDLLRELSAIEQRLPAGYVLGAFAKTGTMQVPPQSARSCPSGTDLRHCYGSSFALVLAIYESGTAPDPATGRLSAAPSVQPVCALTMFVNLPAHPAGRAGHLTAALLGDGIARRLVGTNGEVCDGLA